MDEGIQTTQEVDPNRDPALPGTHPTTRRKPAGRKPKPCVDIHQAAQGAAGGLRKTFPWLNGRLGALSDPRMPEMCVYSSAHLWWTGELYFLTRAGSRNAFDQTRNSGAAPHNMGAFCGQTADDPRFAGDAWITCSDNVAHHLARVDAAEVQDTRPISSSPATGFWRSLRPPDANAIALRTISTQGKTTGSDSNTSFALTPMRPKTSSPSCRWPPSTGLSSTMAS